MRNISIQLPEKDLSFVSELIKRMGWKLSSLVSVSPSDDSLLSEEDLLAKVRRSEQQIAEGKFYDFCCEEDLETYLKNR